ncbi:TPA: hypothetical protein ACX6Q7_002923 [Photobacterium damselae]
MFRKFIIIIFGPASAHIFTLLLTPYLISHYSLFEFGEYGFLVALTGVFLAFSCLRFDSILLVCDKDEINKIYVYGFLVLLFTSSIITFFAFVFNYKYWIYLFFNIFSNGLLLLYNSYLIRLDLLFKSSLIRFIFIVSIVLIQWYLAYMDVGNGLLIGILYSSIIFITVMSIHFLYVFRKGEEYGIYFLSKYESFYKVNSLSVLINSCSCQFLPISSNFLFGSDFVGLVNIFQRLFVTPIGFVFRVVIQIYNREFSKLINNRLYDLAKKFFIRTMIISFLFSFFISIFLYCFFSLTNYVDVNIFNNYYIPFLLIVLSQSFFISISQSLSFINCHHQQLKAECFRILAFFVIFSIFYFVENKSYLYLSMYSLCQFIFCVYIVRLIFLGLKSEKSIYENT